MKRNEARSRWSWAAAALVFFLASISAMEMALTGCGSSSSRQLISIAVTPPGGDAVEPMGTLPYAATGTFSRDPTIESVTAVQWSSSNPKVASIDASTGVATCLAPGGPVTITASDSGVSGTGTLTCLAAARARTGHCIYTCNSITSTCALSSYCSGMVGNACTQSYDSVNCQAGEPTNIMSTDTCGQLVDETRSCAP